MSKPDPEKDGMHPLSHGDTMELASRLMAEVNSLQAQIEDLEAELEGYRRLYSESGQIH